MRDVSTSILKGCIQDLGQQKVPRKIDQKITLTKMFLVQLYSCDFVSFCNAYYFELTGVSNGCWKWLLVTQLLFQSMGLQRNLKWQLAHSACFHVSLVDYLNDLRVCINES